MRRDGSEIRRDQTKAIDLVDTLSLNIQKHRAIVQMLEAIFELCELHGGEIPPGMWEGLQRVAGSLDEELERTHKDVHLLFERHVRASAQPPRPRGKTRGPFG